MLTGKAKIFPASRDGLGSLQECREEQTLKSFDRDRGTLGLGLKDCALQRRNQEAGDATDWRISSKI
jgi:hypothetical protein